LGLTRFGGQVG